MFLLVLAIVALQFTLLYRIVQMPTQSDLDAAVAAVSAKFDAGFTALAASITQETAIVLAKISATPGVPQAVIDEITALGTKFDAGIAAARAAIAAEVP